MLQITSNYMNEIFWGVDPDSQFNNMFLTTSIYPTLYLSFIYLVVTAYIGPKLMQNRKPFILKTTLMYYNVFQVILSSYIFYLTCHSGWIRGHYSFFKCQSVSTYGNIKEMEYKATYFFFLSKFTEYLDTIFFVLRKKNNQITFLHLYHHSLMPVFCWIGLKYFPGGSTQLGPLLNSFVHIIMYSYYLLSALGYNKVLKWKKYITMLQMAQFIIGMCHTVFVILSRECYIPRILSIVTLTSTIILYKLFQSFFNQSYKEETKITENGSALNNNVYKTD